MADTKDLGPFYFHTMKLAAGAPPTHISSTDEIEEPFRRGKCVIIRLWKILEPGRRRADCDYFAVVFGVWWGKHANEEEAAKAALQGYGLDLYDDDLEDPETAAMIRDNIARQAGDLEEEWTIMSHLGVQ